jgi:predicted RNA-binding Zn ribbon-like protein
VVTTRATDLRIVGGDPALDLANTLEGADSPETLVDFAELTAWATKAGVLAAPFAAAGGEEALAAARRLRTATFAVFTAVARGSEPPPDEVAHIVAVAAEATAHARLVDGALTWTGGEAMRAVWPFATAALDLLRFGPLDRIRTCDVCPWLFIDASRNHSRRWCSMDECGVRDKMQRYRARRATAGR